jgi:hypothetical protein
MKSSFGTKFPATVSFGVTASLQCADF